MIPTFEEVQRISGNVSSAVLLQPQEARLLYEVAAHIPAGGVMVEIGAHYGRSSSLLLRMAKAVGFSTIHIDPYLDTDDYHGQEEILAGWRTLMDSIDYPYTLLRMTTEDAEPVLPDVIDAAYIDGDHTAQGVATDLRIVANRVKMGGWIAVHDFGPTVLGPNQFGERFPEVSQTVRTYTSSGWEQVAIAETMAVWRKL